MFSILGWKKVEAFSDERGTLHVPPLPFEPKHQFCVTNLDGKPRGGHAHRTTKQVIWCAQGYMHAALQRKGVCEVTDIIPGYAICIPPETWVTLMNFSPDCVYFVWWDKDYDESDYIRDPTEFAKLSGSLPRPVASFDGQVYVGDPSWTG